MKKGNLLLAKLSSMLVGALLIDNVAHAQLDAHVHGLSNLTLALEENVIEMEFHSPAMNLVGFEHKATSQKNIEKVNNAKHKLQQDKQIYTFQGTQCLIDSISIGLYIYKDLYPTEHHHAHETTHGHEKKHDHHHKHDHDDKHDIHSEVVANYRFSCENVKALKSIEVSLFQHFPGVDKINAMWVTDQGQGSVTLNKDQRTINFRP